MSITTMTSEGIFVVVAEDAGVIVVYRFYTACHGLGIALEGVLQQLAGL